MPRTLLRGLVVAVTATLVAALGAAVDATAARPDSRLLAYLNQISGQRTISGQHNREPNSDPTK